MRLLRIIKLSWMKKSNQSSQKWSNCYNKDVNGYCHVRDVINDKCSNTDYVDIKINYQPVLHCMQDYPSHHDVICVKYSNIRHNYANNTTGISYKHCSFFKITSSQLCRYYNRSHCTRLSWLTVDSLLRQICLQVICLQNQICTIICQNKQS